jgi:hypothetical protein
MSRWRRGRPNSRRERQFSMALTAGSCCVAYSRARSQSQPKEGVMPKKHSYDELPSFRGDEQAAQVVSI